MTNTNRIKQLSVDLINKIAAGEVIERPSSVVKELVENSIDAGASKIEIRINNGCRNIRIADNGCGIHPDDIEIAFNKHSTSKIKKYEDLWEISSLGFRGEALSSILSISKMTCITRIKEEEKGTKVEFIDNEMHISKIGSSIGTIFDIKDLFYNVPARLKFLKNAKTEFSYIQETITNVALSNPCVSLTLINNDKEVFKTTGTSDLYTCINELYGDSVTKNLLEVKNIDLFNKQEIEGFISIPTYERSSKKSIYLFVNKRPVKCQVFTKAIDMAYKNRMEKGKYPFIVLNLKMNTNNIDINVHPQKKEVRYDDPNKVFGFLFNSLNKTLEKANYHEKDMIAFSINSKYKEKEDEEDILVTEKQLVDNTQVTFYNISNATKEDINKPNKNIRTFVNETDYQENKPINEITFKVLGQFLNTYILFEENNQLYIVDQHIADERVIYNKLKEKKEKSSQIILLSDIFDIEPSDGAYLEENKQFFQSYGYDYLIRDGNKIVFRKIPQIISHIKLKDILSEILKVTNEQEPNNLEEKLLISTSCKAAIKAGDSLMPWQMYNLIESWKNTTDNLVCPHGRPIVHKFSEKEIATYFKRQVITTL